MLLSQVLDELCVLCQHFLAQLAINFEFANLQYHSLVYITQVNSAFRAH